MLSLAHFVSNCVASFFVLKDVCLSFLLKLATNLNGFLTVSGILTVWTLKFGFLKAVRDAFCLIMCLRQSEEGCAWRSAKWGHYVEYVLNVWAEMVTLWQPSKQKLCWSVLEEEVTVISDLQKSQVLCKLLTAKWFYML